LFKKRVLRLNRIEKGSLVEVLELKKNKNEQSYLNQDLILPFKLSHKKQNTNDKKVDAKSVVLKLSTGNTYVVTV
jgi:hypothetical protein